MPTLDEFKAKLRESAHDGAVLLDNEVPCWQDKIDLKTLYLGNPQICILGQVFRTPQDEVCSSPTRYERGMRALGLWGNVNDPFSDDVYGANQPHAIPIALGFDIVDQGEWPEETSSDQQVYIWLGEAWKEEILARQAERPI